MNSIFLLIEDNTIDQVVTAQLLRKMIGATQIFVVKNGIEAIEWLKNVEINSVSHWLSYSMSGCQK